MNLALKGQKTEQRGPSCLHVWPSRDGRRLSQKLLHLQRVPASRTIPRALPWASSVLALQAVLWNHHRMSFPKTKIGKSLWRASRWVVKRCVAESNRSIWFCRPTHNRFVNAPNYVRLQVACFDLRMQRYKELSVYPNFFLTFSCSRVVFRLFLSFCVAAEPVSVAVRARCILHNPHKGRRLR